MVHLLFCFFQGLLFLIMSSIPAAKVVFVTSKTYLHFSFNTAASRLLCSRPCFPRQSSLVKSAKRTFFVRL